MTLTQIKTRVKYRCGVSDSKATYDDAITYACELVQDEIMSLINFSSLMVLDKTSINMTAATQTYSLPTDFWKMSVIWNNTSYERELIRITPPEYKMYLGDLDDTDTTPTYYDLQDSSATAKKIIFFGFLASGGTSYYIPFVYVKKLAYLSDSNGSHILSALYGNLFVEGATYYLYRDQFYKDQPEKIAFRRNEYMRQVEMVRRVERSPDKIDAVLPKRLLPQTTQRLYRIPSSDYGD
jgi:hypothetical protein